MSCHCHEHKHEHEHEHEHEHGCCHDHGHSHSHGHSHEHGGEGESRVWLRAGISAALLAVGMAALEGTAALLVCIAGYLVIGYPVLKEAVENILHGELFDENFLMTVASIGAFCIGDYAEATAVMLLYNIGEALQDKAVDSSRRSIRALVSIRPDHANRVTENGVETVAAESVSIGDTILVRPGERIPLDGEVTEGSSYVDTSALTGESLPRQWQTGDTALAGCVVIEGVLTLRVTRSFGDSSVSRILEMVENAQDNKAQPERFITRFARIYTPVVCGAAVLVAVLPPLLGMGAWGTWIHKALAFLVISCPCALVISVPLSFFSGIGCASHNGILMKGSNYLELLAKAEVAAFDKTGTLTCGDFRVSGMDCAEGVTEDELLTTAALCEGHSSHPIAAAIRSAYGKEIDTALLLDVKELSGHGVSATIHGETALAGKRALVAHLDGVPDDETAETAVYVARNGRYLGRIRLADTVKSDAAGAVSALRFLGLHHLTMLSGDRQPIADEVARRVGLDNGFGELLPEDKVARLRELKANGITLYAGDGINDAPVLAAADVGIAMGGLGSDAAMEAADVVIMNDQPSKIPQAIRIARKTVRIAKENIAFSLAVKAAVLLVSLFCDMGLWLAVFADVGVCMLAILNSLRVLRTN